MTASRASTPGSGRWAAGACRPRWPQTKGKVERLVAYVAGNALAGTSATFDSWSDLNGHLRAWCQTVANRRFHRELGEPVETRLARESTTLISLPQDRFDTAYRGQRVVSLDAYVLIDGVCYSVPGHLVGQRSSLRIQLDGRIGLADLAGTVVVRHHKIAGDQRVLTIAEHYAALWSQVCVQARGFNYYAEAG